jgi:hypothetical protein
MKKLHIFTYAVQDTCMEHEQYLLVFSGNNLGNECISDEVISQLSTEMERFGITDIEMVSSPFAELTIQYLIALADGLSDQIYYDYSTIKITYKEPIALNQNGSLDSFLNDLVLGMDEPCGASYAYLVEEDGIRLHQFAIVSTLHGVHRDVCQDFIKEISPITFYRHFYNKPLHNEDIIQEAKMLLVAGEEDL